MHRLDPFHGRGLPGHGTHGGSPAPADRQLQIGRVLRTLAIAVPRGDLPRGGVTFELTVNGAAVAQTRVTLWKKYGWAFGPTYLDAEVADVKIMGKSCNRYEEAADRASNGGGGYTTAAKGFKW